MAADTAPGPWVVARVVNKDSQYGNSIYDITFINNRGEIAHSYIDPSNRNYKKWETVIDLFDRGWGIILDDLRYKTKDGHMVYKNHTQEPLINADSRVKQIFATPHRQQVIDQLYEVLYS